MKKFLPLVASLMLLAACGGANQPQGGSPSQPQASDSEPAATSSQASEEYKMTFLQNSEIYIDFNFNEAPEGLSIKIGNTTLTASGKATMSQNFTYEVNGTFSKALNVYYAIDTGGANAAGALNGLDAEMVKTRLGQYFDNFKQRQYQYRIYFCLTDKENGWSKTLAGVDEIIRSKTGSGQAQ